MRRLVVCADGTWRSQDDVTDTTNVEKLHDAVLPRSPDGTAQLRAYFPGVGTTRWERLVGGAFGVGLSRNVKQAYGWLAERYEGPTDDDPGDELHLFGFSRGAYTVRSLAGMVRNVGLLRPEHLDRLDEAYAHYRDRDRAWSPDGSRSVAFRERWSRDVPSIRCLGVWDTVGALGVPTRGPVGHLTRRRWGFHDVELSRRVQNGFHALAVDEQRRAFAPTLWLADDAHAGEQHVEQVWFAGTHSDVGGGTDDCGLSDTTLRWMAGKAADCGLALDQARLRALAPDAARGRLHDSFSLPFRLQGRHVRPLCEEPPSPPGRSMRSHQSVHASVLDRHARCTDPPVGPYTPVNLLRYLAQVPRQATQESTSQGAPRPSAASDR